MKLPSYFTLAGTTHFPAIDNQGGIGSCASQSITHNQFSHAVSRYLHSIESGCTRCPRDNANERFSPKYTYNFAGAGTIWVYEVLQDHGALTVDECVFAKDPNGGSQKIKDGKTIAQSASWAVNPGQMERAIQNRVRNWDRVWFTGEPYNEKLTTSEEGLKLLTRIKESVLAGNPVVTGGYPSRWIYEKVKGCGTLSAVGEGVVVAAAGNSGGGHQVTIVGYDDDITCTFGGVTLKGAFHIANSYGTGWQNKGYTWMMYDAINTVSEFAELNEGELYSGYMHITPTKMAMYPESLTSENQLLRIEKMGTAVVGGKEYTAYSFYEEKSEHFMTYRDDPADRRIYMERTPRPWVFIPYEDLKNLPNYSAEYYDEKYKNSYWIYAVERDCPEDGMRFIDAGVAFSASGRHVGFATMNGSRYPEAKSFEINSMAECFESKISATAGKGQHADRVWVLDQFAFMDWKTDLDLERPALYAKVTVEIDDREGFFVTMTRTDKNGNKETYLPALFRYGKYHPSYTAKENYLTFSGLVNEGPEKGYFALTFGELLKFAEGTTAADYTFGLDITAKDGKKLVVHDIALCDKDTNVLFEKAVGDTIENDTKSYILQ